MNTLVLGFPQTLGPASPCGKRARYALHWLRCYCLRPSTSGQGAATVSAPQGASTHPPTGLTTGGGARAANHGWKATTILQVRQHVVGRGTLMRRRARSPVERLSLLVVAFTSVVLPRA